MNLNVIYRQIEKGLSFSPKLHGKWYAITTNDIGGKRLVAYLSPNGWQETAFYFNSQEEAAFWSQLHLYVPQSLWQKIFSNQVVIERMYVPDRLTEESFYDFEDQAFRGME